MPINPDFSALEAVITAKVESVATSIDNKDLLIQMKALEAAVANLALTRVIAEGTYQQGQVTATANTAVTTLNDGVSTATTNLNTLVNTATDSLNTASEAALDSFTAGTTATSANTASAIVARDASGNFAAGTVTAALTGNVTGTVSGNAGTVTNGVYTTDTGTVTSTMITDATIVNADLSASAGIAYSKLSLNASITSADIVDGTIVAGDIANATITAAKMVTDPYARANHTGTQLASTVSDFNTAVRTNRLDQMAAPTASVPFNTQKITGLLDPTLAQDASTKAYVDAQITALVGGAAGTLDTLGEIATAISSGGSVINTLVLKAGDTMTGALTLSGAPTVGLHAATKTYVDGVAGSASAAAASAAAAEASYDSFDDRYLGSKATAPTLDNDGNALITGALYWNSVAAVMYVWDGAAWGAISSTAEIFRYKFNASGGETSASGLDANSVTLSYIAGKEQVYLNGVLLVRGTDYTATNGTSITALAALAASDVLEIITFTAFNIATTINTSVLAAKGTLITASAASTPAAIAVGVNGQVLTADSTQSNGLIWADSSVGAAVVAPALVANSANSYGYIGTPQNSKADNYTIVLADMGKDIYVTVTGKTITINSNANLALQIGSSFVVTNDTGVTTTIAITTDDLILANSASTGSRTLAPYGIAVFKKVTATKWIGSGNGLT